MTVPQPQWDPQQYLRYATHRVRPLRELLARVPELPREPARIADLGCGPGEPTTPLADRWPSAHITGYDQSAEMLAAAERYAGPTAGGGQLDFVATDLVGWVPPETYDLLFSNALLQWIPDHPASFPRWIEALAPKGVFAFQVAGNHSAPSHTLLTELCESPPWRERLGSYVRRGDVVLSPAEYLERLTGLGCAVDAWETTYQQLLPGEDAVFDWVKGAVLRPLLTALRHEPERQRAFLECYRDALREAYPRGPHGTVFPFRRIFVVAQRVAG